MSSPTKIPLILAALVCFALAGCNEDEKGRATVASQPATPQAVQVMTVRLVPSEQSWSYAGIVRPRYESDLSFRVGGKIIERRVEVGQSVDTGQILARLDPTDYDLAVQSQQAELDAAQTSRQEAERAAQRYRTLLKDGFAAKAAYDQKVTAEGEARSRVKRAERGLELAKNQLAYAELKANQPGVVSALPIEIGQVVAAGQLITRIARHDTLEVQVAIPELALDSVRPAQAHVELWGSKGQLRPAKLRELAPEADPVSRTFQARFALETGGDAVAIGRSATVHLTQGASKPVAQLPLSAVMSDGRGATVWLVDASGTRVRRASVEIQALTQDQAVIAAGLAENDRVVTLGVHMLDEARAVQIIEQRVQTE